MEPLVAAHCCSARTTLPWRRSCACDCTPPVLRWTSPIRPNTAMTAPAPAATLRSSSIWASGKRRYRPDRGHTRASCKTARRQSSSSRGSRARAKDAASATPQHPGMAQQADRFRAPHQDPQGGHVGTPRQRPLILHVDDDADDMLALVARELAPMADVISADCIESALRSVSSREDRSRGARYRAGRRLPASTCCRIFAIATATCSPSSCSPFMPPMSPASDQINSAVSKLNSPLESLTRAVRERLALLPALAA